MSLRQWERQPLFGFQQPGEVVYACADSVIVETTSAKALTAKKDFNISLSQNVIAIRHPSR
jgi:hypothetical protein